MGSFFSIPNIFSCARMVLTVLFIKALLWSDNGSLMALFFFTLAAGTDIIDGYVARNYNAVTKWGAFLDPLADKFLIFSAFVVFYFKGLVLLWFLIVVSLRDILVTLLRFILLSGGRSLETSLFAKGKTVAQFFAIYALFAYQLLSSYAAYNLWVPACTQALAWLLYAVAAVTLYSGWEYFYRYFQQKEASIFFSSKSSGLHNR